MVTVEIVEKIKGDGRKYYSGILREQRIRDVGKRAYCEINIRKDLQLQNLDIMKRSG